MNIRNRIIELRHVPASSLRPNPRNWRTHSALQVDALKEILSDVGYAGAALARELPDGTLELIDGHARAEVTGEGTMPILVLDVTEEEANKILLTFDPVGAMAGADAVKLEELLTDVHIDNAPVNAMLDEMAKNVGIVVPAFEPVGIEQQGKLDEKQKLFCPNCGHEF